MSVHRLPISEDALVVRSRSDHRATRASWSAGWRCCEALAVEQERASGEKSELKCRLPMLRGELVVERASGEKSELECRLSMSEDALAMLRGELAEVKYCLCLNTVPSVLE